MDHKQARNAPLVLEIALLLAGDPDNATHAHRFSAFYGRLLLSLCLDVGEDTTEEKHGVMSQEGMSAAGSLLGGSVEDDIQLDDVWLETLLKSLTPLA